MDVELSIEVGTTTSPPFPPGVTQTRGNHSSEKQAAALSILEAQTNRHGKA